MASDKRRMEILVGIFVLMMELLDLKRQTLAQTNALYIQDLLAKLQKELT